MKNLAIQIDSDFTEIQICVDGMYATVKKGGAVTFPNNDEIYTSEFLDLVSNLSTLAEDSGIKDISELLIASLSGKDE